MDERTANAVARLILGDRKPDAQSSAVNPLSTGPGVHEAQEGGDARSRSSGGVSEEGLEPPRPIRTLGPQPPKSHSIGLLRVHLGCSGHHRRSEWRIRLLEATQEKTVMDQISDQQSYCALQ
jgi:hypothetical protein